MKAVVQRWIERDSWSGPSDDGCSVHLDEFARKEFIKRYWARMPNNTPETYESPEGAVYEIDIPDEEYDKLVQAVDTYGIRLYVTPDWAKRLV